MSVRVRYNYIYAYSFAVEMGRNGYHGEVRVRAYVLIASVALQRTKPVMR